MISRRHTSVLCAAAAVVLLSANAASAQLTPFFDHLKCYKVKDFLKVKPFKADLIPEQVAAGFQIEQGCKIVMPAKLFCIDVRKTNVQPPPPFVVNGTGNARDYLCYKIACPKPPTLPQLVIRDQFGRRDVFIKPPKFLCAPAEKENQPTPVPTRTPTPVPTFTPPPQPTATRTPTCEFNTATGQCGGPCPNPGEQCVFFSDPATGVATCDCIPPDPNCHVSGFHTCDGLCPDPADKCIPAPNDAGCICTHPCQPSNTTGVPSCSGDCPNAGETCVANAAGGCDCRPSTGIPCGSAAAPQCDGTCPNNGEACVQNGPTSCFCETGTPPACGALQGPPTCWGACPANTACVVTGPAPGNCQCQ